MKQGNMGKEGEEKSCWSHLPTKQKTAHGHTLSLSVSAHEGHV